MVKHLLLDCYQYFDSLKLNNDCTESKCQVPDHCSSYNAVFNILQFLADVDFINVNDSTAILKETMIFLPIARSTKALSFYHRLDKKYDDLRKLLKPKLTSNSFQDINE